MPYTTHPITDASTFDTSLATIVAQHCSASTHVFVLVTGSLTDTGKSWCPDCEEAKEPIRQALSSLSACCLIECAVTRENWKGNSGHPYRIHPVLKTPAIPTLYSITPSPLSVKGRLVEEECAVSELLAKLAKL